jgi:hypothetical protein
LQILLQCMKKTLRAYNFLPNLPKEIKNVSITPSDKKHEVIRPLVRGPWPIRQIFSYVHCEHGELSRSSVMINSANNRHTKSDINLRRDMSCDLSNRDLFCTLINEVFYIVRTERCVLYDVILSPKTWKDVFDRLNQRLQKGRRTVKNILEARSNVSKTRSQEFNFGCGGFLSF